MILAGALALLGCGDDTESLSGAEVEWVSIPAGAFDMGCGEADPDCDHTGFGFGETPRHAVDVPAFEMTRTEITQYQYWRVTGDISTGHGKCGDCPVEYMPKHFEDATAFCEAIGGRLPSEAEWEYAARAGTTTRYYCGDDASCLDRIAWYRHNSSQHEDTGSFRPSPVAQMEPNAFGLYDMAGNLMEWTADCWHSDFEGAPTDGSAWISDSDCVSHVFKGGSYNSRPQWLRSSNRYWDPTDIRGIADGFRCARDREP